MASHTRWYLLPAAPTTATGMPWLRAAASLLAAAERQGRPGGQVQLAVRSSASWDGGAGAVAAAGMAVPVLIRIVSLLALRLWLGIKSACYRESDTAFPTGLSGPLPVSCCLPPVLLLPAGPKRSAPCNLAFCSGGTCAHRLLLEEIAVILFNNSLCSIADKMPQQPLTTDWLYAALTQV